MAPLRRPKAKAPAGSSASKNAAMDRTVERSRHAAARSSRLAEAFEAVERFHVTDRGRAGSGDPRPDRRDAPHRDIVEAVESTSPSRSS